MGDCACSVPLSKLAGSSQSTYFIELTAQCNNACPGCDNVYRDDRSAAALPAEDWVWILNTLAPTAAEFRLTGGEPTLHPQFEEIVAHLDVLEVPFTLFTNGRWTEPERLLRSLMERSLLTGLLISLHGSQRAVISRAKMCHVHGDCVINVCEPEQV